MKPVILIGGTNGVGKSTIARNLFCKFPFDHYIAAGFIREILRTIMPVQDCPAIHTYTYKPLKNLDVISSYQLQCNSMKQYIEACLKRAKMEGISLILEGSNLVPSIFDFNCFDLFILLHIEDETKHEKRVNSASHTKRIIGENEFQNIRTINRYLLLDTKSLKKNNVIIIENINNNLTIRKVFDEIYNLM